MRMADEFEGEVKGDSLQPFQLRSLYNIGGMQFVVPEPVTRGIYDIFLPIKGAGTAQCGTV
jgi:hypothetical protein